MKVAVFLLNWAPHKLLSSHVAGATLKMSGMLPGKSSPQSCLPRLRNEWTEEGHLAGMLQSLDFNLCFWAVESEGNGKPYGFCGTVSAGAPQANG